MLKIFLDYIKLVYSLSVKDGSLLEVIELGLLDLSLLGLNDKTFNNFGVLVFDWSTKILTGGEISDSSKTSFSLYSPSLSL